MMVPIGSNCKNMRNQTKPYGSRGLTHPNNPYDRLFHNRLVVQVQLNRTWNSQEFPVLIIPSF